MEPRGAAVCSAAQASLQPSGGDQLQIVLNRSDLTRMQLSSTVPRGSRYLSIKELGLKDHDYYGFWGLSP